MTINSQQVIAEIAHAETTAEALSLFLMFNDSVPELQRCKFVFAADSGALPGFALNRTFAAGSAIRSVFHSEKILVLDSQTVKEMAPDKEITFPIDYSISLDTQALSYLAPYIDGQRKRLPPDFKEVFEFIARDDVFVDGNAYMQENLFNLRDTPEKTGEILKRLRAYEVLRTLDQAWLQQHDEVCSIASDDELDRRAQALLEGMQEDLQNKKVMEMLEYAQQTLYCQLLKMALIQLRNPRAPIAKKMGQYVEFMDGTLATIFAREMAVARAFFERGQDLLFFKHIQVKRPEIFDKLNGMAWDLWHIRQLELSMTLKPSKGARYFFPALLTCDVNFIEIIDLYPLKCCAYIEGQHQPMPVYDGNWWRLVADTPEALEAFQQRYYSAAARRSRDERRDGVNGQLVNIVSALEDELSQLAGVEKPAGSAVAIC